MKGVLPRLVHWACHAGARDFCPALAALVGRAVFKTVFFICFEANLSEYGSYSLHIHMFWYIRKHHIFA
jgi:hypothetical protein